MKLAGYIWVALAAAVFSPSLAMAQAIQQVPYAALENELATRIDFETYPKVPSPGRVLDGIEVLDGARFAERFQGQLVNQVAGFDALHLDPVGPLQLQAGVPGHNLAVVFIFYMSNQLKGMAPPGFPEVDAGGARRAPPSTATLFRKQ